MKEYYYLGGNSKTERRNTVFELYSELGDAREKIKKNPRLIKELCLVRLEDEDFIDTIRYLKSGLDGSILASYATIREDINKIRKKEERNNVMAKIYLICAIVNVVFMLEAIVRERTAKKESLRKSDLVWIGIVSLLPVINLISAFTLLLWRLMEIMSSGK